MSPRSSDATATEPAPMRVADALALICGRLRVSAGVETVAIAGSVGRILAADVAAPLALPPFDNSAVDGYAFRAADLAPTGPTTLPVAGRVPAGAEAASLPWGAAARIFTGAPLPPGADTVAMQEDVRFADGAVTLNGGIVRGANCRRAGEDVAAGSLALPIGRRLGAKDLALAAALGLPALPVRTRLRVGLFSTGDEVSALGGPLAPAGIHDANGPMLAALLARFGALPCPLGILRDDPASLRARLAAAAAEHDLIVTSGGVSVGEEDHVRAAVGAGGGITLWRLAIKPGRPLAFGHVGETPFVGLPGNPGAAYVTALAILLPVVLHLSGGTPEPPLPLVRSGFALGKRAGRREYLRVCLRPGGDGLTEAVPAPGGALSALAASDGLAELAEDMEAVRPGDLLPFRAHPLG
ncbi:gephyrin-like molybdotransferase Glp [Methylobacterium sp. J-076]|uniref:molybdopterin molybdotransferase MoeA n=1 Tax=Methylobacterium sp. J-076 TaxID=2836655 RepID=UPI001FB9426D|nr:gephyrin-like molybdotransferase Glp [Methylobacterium sp. J-076]MCJ2013357.1 molybdopterin molybdotransferase MoeA [Methylobacterium sp. J-076]